MQPYTIQIVEGTQAHILRKESGRKRSLRLFFFRIKRRRTLIAYFVNVQDTISATYTLYKIRRTGLWLRGGERENGKVKNNDKLLMEDIKKSIDKYEGAYGSNAHKFLF